MPNLKNKHGFDSNASSAELLSARSRTDENVSNIFVTRNDARSQRKLKDIEPNNSSSRNRVKVKTTRTVSELPKLERSAKHDIAEVRNIIRTCLHERGTDILSTKIEKFNNSIS